MNKLIMKQKNLKNRKGFTLIELIVVIAILGILAAVLVPQFSGFKEKAEMTQVLTDASAVSTAADALLYESSPPAAPSAGNIEKLAGVASGSVTGVKLTAGDTFVQYTYTRGAYKAERDSTGKVTASKVVTP